MMMSENYFHWICMVPWGRRGSAIVGMGGKEAEDKHGEEDKLLKEGQKWV
jgi:hypothetical protein